MDDGSLPFLLKRQQGPEFGGIFDGIKIGQAFQFKTGIDEDGSLQIFNRFGFVTCERGSHPQLVENSLVVGVKPVGFLDHFIEFWIGFGAVGIFRPIVIVRQVLLFLAGGKE